MAVAARALESGGHIAIEWPASCAYWGWDDVRDFIDKHGLSVVRIDGCALGVKSPRTGIPIRKPWKIATSSKVMCASMAGFRCDGSHEHAQCRGADAKATEDYSDEMAAVIHQCHAEVLRLEKVAAMKAAVWWVLSHAV